MKESNSGEEIQEQECIVPSLDLVWVHFAFLILLLCDWSAYVVEVSSCVTAGSPTLLEPSFPLNRPCQRLSSLSCCRNYSREVTEAFTIGVVSGFLINATKGILVLKVSVPKGGIWKPPDSCSRVPYPQLTPALTSSEPHGTTSKGNKNQNPMHGATYPGMQHLCAGGLGPADLGTGAPPQYHFHIGQLQPRLMYYFSPSLVSLDQSSTFLCLSIHLWRFGAHVPGGVEPFRSCMLSIKNAFEINYNLRYKTETRSWLMRD